MELDELEVGQRRSGPVREQRAVADGARGVRRALPEGGHAAGGEHGSRRCDGAFRGDDANAALVVLPQGPDLPARKDLDAGMRECALRELPGDPLAGRGPAGMDDSTPRVAAFEAEPLVELNARVGQVDDPGGRLLGQGAHGARAAQPPAGAERVLLVQSGGVVRPDRGRDATLRQPARRREDGPLRDDRDASLGRCGERRGQTGDAGPDDDDVVRAILHQSCPAW